MRGAGEDAVVGGGRLLRLIESVYAAVDAPEMWDGVLRQVGDLLQGDSVALFSAARDERLPGLVSISEMDDAAWRQFVQYYAAINPIMQRCERRLQVGTTWYADAVIGDAELEKTEFYVDFFRPNAMHYSVGLRVEAAGLPAANLSCQRRKGAGAFGLEADLVLQTLRPHLTRALQLRMHLLAMEAKQQGLERALEAYDHAVVGVDAQGRVVLCSRLAEAMLAGGYGLRLRNKRLCCDDVADQELLQKALMEAICLEHGASAGLIAEGRAAGAGGSAGPRSQALVLRGVGGGSEVRVTVLPHRRGMPGQSAWLAALVFLVHSARKPASRAQMLMKLYGLTPTEARVADLLAEGMDGAGVAACLGVTQETARFYVKRLLAKTGTSRQMALLRLILSFPAE